MLPYMNTREILWVQVLNSATRKATGEKVMIGHDEIKRTTNDSVSLAPLLWAIAAVLTVVLSPHFSYAATNQVAKFTVVSGSVDALREQQDAPIAAEIGMDTYMKDVVRTKRRSRTQLKFIDDSVLNMGPDYMVKIKEYVYDEESGMRKAILSSLRGTMRATVAKLEGDGDSYFEVETPTAVASVRGTDFIVKVNSSMESEVVVLEGAVMVRNIDPRIEGQVMVRAGQRTTVAKGKTPSLPVLAAPQMQNVLIAETTPTAVMASAPSPADVVPVATPPPAPASFSTSRMQPVIASSQATVAPVQPPITTTIPAIITTPVVLNLIF